MIEAVVVPKELYYHEVRYVRGLEAEVERLKGALDTLDEAHKITQQGLWQDITELRASCTSLREIKDTFFRNAEAWETKCNEAWRERDEWREHHDRADHRAFAYAQEIERLKSALADIACGAWVQRYEALHIARAALEAKP